MPALLDLIAQVQALNLPPGSPTAQVLDQALDALLIAEGPPSQPLENFSEGLKTVIARTLHHRPLFLCHTWTTAPWTCLLIDLPPVAMGRPIFIRNPQTGLGRISIDYRCQKFQKRIVVACLALQIPPPPTPSRLAIQVDSHRFFLAWAPHLDPVPNMSTGNEREGDLDNYAKNLFDGLQRSRLIQNDRTVASYSAAKAIIPTAAQSLDDVLTAAIREALQKHPKSAVKTIAGVAGVSLRKTRAILREIKQANISLSAISNEEGTPPASNPLIPAGDSLSTGSGENAPAVLIPAAIPAQPAQALDPILA